MGGGGMRFVRIRLALFLTLTVCLVVISVCHRPILAFMAHWLDVGVLPRPADYVMVLPGGPEQRPFVAAAMVRAGLAKGVLTAETQTDPANDEGLVPTTDDVLRRILMLRGVREDQIQVLPGHSKSTWTDALALSQFMREHPQATIAIVTDCYHTRRSSWVFQRVLRGDASRVFFVSARLSAVDPNSWWTTEEGLTTYLSEYSKLFFYVATDQTVIVLVGGIGMAMIVGSRFWRKRAARSQGSTDTAAATLTG